MTKQLSIRTLKTMKALRDVLEKSGVAIAETCFIEG